ncbi:hypothetical protein BRD00_15095 [Halobacteriales archaeon QS_8_69_26]|nr:MAG: hypothetical protein BRD00_15095 [Halobacteriales archaeon QS_8_69_26]
MGDKKLILFELHLDGDLQIGPKTVSRPGSGRLSGLLGDEGEEDDEAAAEPFSEGGGGGLPVRRVLGLAVALAGLAGMAVAVGHLLGGDEDVEEDVEVGLEE